MFRRRQQNLVLGSAGDSGRIVANSETILKDVLGSEHGVVSELLDFFQPTRTSGARIKIIDATDQRDFLFKRHLAEQRFGSLLHFSGGLMHTLRHRPCCGTEQHKNCQAGTQPPASRARLFESMWSAPYS